MCVSVCRCLCVCVSVCRCLCVCVSVCRCVRQYIEISKFDIRYLLQITETPSQTETLVYKSNSYCRSGNFRVSNISGVKFSWHLIFVV